MVIELSHRAQRVRFKHPVRVIPLDGSPRIYRTLSANLSRKGMFVRMPEPLPRGTRVALSLEVKGQALPFAEAEIAWCRTNQSQLPGRFVGFGVRFTSFLNPRAPELVDYLVKNLDRGHPLTLVPPGDARRRRWLGVGLAAVAALGLTWSGVSAVHQWTSAPTEDLEAAAPMPEDDEAVLEVPEAAAASPSAEPPVEVVEPPAAAPAPAPALAVAPPEEPVGGDVEAAASGSRGGAARGAAPIVAAPAAPVGGDVEAASGGSRVGATRGTATIVAAPVAPPTAVARRVEGPPRERSVRKGRPTDGRVSLPSGAAMSLAWAGEGDALRVDLGLAPGASITRRFLLDGPPRLVVELEGRTPTKTQTVRADGAWIKRVRIGRHGAATHLVVDLARAPKGLRATEQGVALTFTR